MYQVSIEQHFDAAHYLREYQGKCEALHGHRFRAVVRVEAASLDRVGMAYDFTRLKAHLRDILSRLDHTCLNDLPPFDTINPSSENLARNIFDELKDRLKGEPVTLACVEVWESPESRVTYIPD